MEPLNRRSLLDELEKYKVIVLTQQKVIQVTDDGVVTVSTASGERQLFKAAKVVLALGATPVRGLAKILEGKVAQLYLVGDC